MESEELVAVVAVSGVVAALAARWWFGANLSPDPWESDPVFQRATTEEIPLCLKCLEPKADHLCICPHCGSAMDAAARIIPFPTYRTLGDVLRSGTDPERKRPGFLMSLGYVAVSFQTFLPLAPFYWWRLARTRPRPPKPDSEESASGSKP